MMKSGVRPAPIQTFEERVCALAIVLKSYCCSTQDQTVECMLECP